MDYTYGAGNEGVEQGSKGEWWRYGLRRRGTEGCGGGVGMYRGGKDDGDCECDFLFFSPLQVGRAEGGERGGGKEANRYTVESTRRNKHRHAERGRSGSCHAVGLELV